MASRRVTYAITLSSNLIMRAYILHRVIITHIGVYDTRAVLQTVIGPLIRRNRAVARIFLDGDTEPLGYFIYVCRPPPRERLFGRSESAFNPRWHITVARSPAAI